ncbi:MAG: SRPBCC family protein [Schumannella sp.]|nr:SRPBCC family protein [Microbacteriaceae bacterium]
MGMLTSARVEIAAPASEVFAWLIEPAKLTAWLGAAGAMPEDTSQLRAGWTGSSESPPLGTVSIEIRVYNPPERLEYRTVYPGGDALTTYRLTEGDGVTTLVCEGDTDWARPEGAWDAMVDAAVEGQPEGTREAVQAQLDEAEMQLDAGRFDSLAQGPMQEALEASLQKLKTLVESGAA